MSKIDIFNELKSLVEVVDSAAWTLNTSIMDVALDRARYAIAKYEQAAADTDTTE